MYCIRLVYMVYVVLNFDIIIVILQYVSLCCIMHVLSLVA